MVAPYARNEVQVDLDGPQTSWPYVAMTMRLMDEFGVTPELIRDPQTGAADADHRPAGHVPRRRPTRSSPTPATRRYFLAAAAIIPGSKVTIEGLGKRACRATSASPTCCTRWAPTCVFGKDFITVTGTDTLEGIDVDLADMPDTAQTLAVVALFADGETTIRGLHTLRVKETDRLAALATELTKLGAEVDDRGRRR